KRTAKFPFLKAVNTESRVLSSSRSSAPSAGRGPTTGGAGPVTMGGALRGDSCETDDPVPLMAPPPDPADDARRTAPAARPVRVGEGVQMPCPPECRDERREPSDCAREDCKSRSLPLAGRRFPHCRRHYSRRRGDL